MTDLAPLTRAEQIALDDCEQRIERGLKVFIEVGSALAFIRDNRLYRASHQTFEAYAKVRFNISRPRAYELITAAEVVSGIPDTLPAPTNAGQATELAKLPEADRADVWAEAVERTGGKPTAAAVRQVAEERAEPGGPEDHPEMGEGRSAGLTSAAGPADASAGSVVDPDAADKLPAAACEACGGPISSVGAEAGYRRCDDCDPDGEHYDRDGVCLGCNPPPDEDEPTPARPPLLSLEEVRQIEAHGERLRAINHARRVAERFLTEVSGFVTDIEAGVLYGETGLFTEDMAAELRKQADRVERYLEGRQ